MRAYFLLHGCHVIKNLCALAHKEMAALLPVLGAKKYLRYFLFGGISYITKYQYSCALIIIAPGSYTRTKIRGSSEGGSYAK